MYILKGYTYSELSNRSNFSIRYLEDKFHKILDTSPPYIPIPKELLIGEYLVLDGLWFGKKLVMMMYRTHKNKFPIKISFMSKEFGLFIKKDLFEIKYSGFNFAGIVSDGGKGIKYAVNEVFKFKPHQICLAHVTRRAKSSIGKNSKQYHIKKLSELIDWMWKIENTDALEYWFKQVLDWEKTNHKYLIEMRWDNTGKHWYVHRGARKALKIIKKSKDTSFKFLRYPLLPKTTNCIEGQFGQIVKKHMVHSGLKRKRVPNFLEWFRYYYVKNMKTKNT